jgi:homoserine dehydrogenase
MIWKLALLGFGNVGQGLARLLVEKRKELKRKYGFEYKVVGIYDIKMGGICIKDGEVDLEKLLKIIDGGGMIADYPGASKDLNALGLIEMCQPDILIEMTFTDFETGQPAVTHCRQALANGIHVVTSNKGPAALAKKELWKLASENGVQFRFEGTVMSGTPAINLATGCLAGAKISGFRGILNGTTNFILTKMEGGMTYDAALAEAQKLGYAEADPTGDVEGWDALGKGVILASTLMDTEFRIKEVPRKGITQLKPADIEQTKKEGKRWKLLVECREKDGKVALKVEPVKVDLTDPLASVGGATNALTFDTDVLGPVTIIGAGAGRKETGFSILIDLLWIHSIARGKPLLEVGE